MNKLRYWLFWRRNHYTIITGHAGFIKLYKNGVRIQPKNFKLEFKA